jgi:superfamily II DNA or RNA helicase
MLASLALRSEFTKLAREHGDESIGQRRVRVLSGGSDTVRAEVDDEDREIVTLKRTSHGDATEFTASCTCRGFVDGDAPCQHVWAALISAERAGHLQGNGDRVPLGRDTAYLTLRGNRPDHSVEDTYPHAPTSGRARAQHPARTAARDFLKAVGECLRLASAAARPVFPFADVTLLYVIDAPASRAAGLTVVTVMAQPRLRGAEASRPRVAALSNDDIAVAPPTERRLLSLLAGGSRRTSQDDRRATDAEPATFALPDALALEVLPLIARLARLWLRVTEHSDPAPLTWDAGNTWTFRVDVREAPEGFSIDGRLERDGVSVRLDDGFVIVAGGLVAIRRTLAHFLPTPATAFLLPLQQTGPVVIDQAEAQDLAAALALTEVPRHELPSTLQSSEVRVAPRPRIAILAPQADVPGSFPASVAFDYDGVSVASTTRGATLFDAATRRLIHRDLAAESAAVARLHALGLRMATGDNGHVLELAQSQFNAVVRTLVDEGWLVEAEGVRYRAAKTVRLSVTSGIDWFDLSASVPFDDEVADLAKVLAAISPERPMVRLGDGSIGIVPEAWLSRYAALLAAGEVHDGRLRFRRSQVALLDVLLGDRTDEAEIAVDAAFDRARRELAEHTAIAPIAEAASFVGTLRPYQRDGLGWFDFLRRFGFGGCLADDMGLGKTIMVLALLDARRAETGDRRPSLIVVPRSLVGNWMAEAERFAPHLRVLDHSHTLRDASTDELCDYDAVVVTYGTLRRDIESLAKVEFDYAVLDEAQTIKNATTASAKAARLIRARHRLALSGTPIENHLGELWSLFEFLNPGILGRSTVFHRATTFGEDLQATASLLARGLRPFVLRRTKQQVAHELPARTEQTILCELLPKDRRLYDRLRTHFRSTVFDHVTREGISKARMHVLEALLRLRQASCHAGLIDPERAVDESAKFDVLVPRLQEVVDEGHKALVFSQFTSLLALLSPRLDAAKIRYEYLDGKTRDRTTRVERFQSDPNVGVFLISLKAGGLGLNLTAADYVFLLDPWWNPAVEAQAIDRAHRIGQTREVFAYRIVAKDTVEEKVLALQRTKRALADAVLSAEAGGLRHLSRDDLEILLG